MDKEFCKGMGQDMRIVQGSAKYYEKLFNTWPFQFSNVYVFWIDT